MALPAAPAYLATAAAVIRQFNRSGLIVTPYLYATVVAAAAVCTIQVGELSALWRVVVARCLG